MKGSGLKGGDMFYQERCGRCGGNLYLERDGVDTDVVCLQCGSIMEGKVSSELINSTSGQLAKQLSGSSKLQVNKPALSVSER
ncbi:hypothetical protein ACFLX5_00175 [Chloroflexota bacterium]